MTVPPSNSDRPILIYGGGETGTETAQYLSERGHHVLIVTRSDRRFLARNAEPLYRIHLLRRLEEDPRIRVVDQMQLVGTGSDHAILAKGGHEIVQPASAVLLAHGLMPDTRLADAMAELTVPVIRIGDAVQVARIGEAVRDAYRMVQDLGRAIAQPEPIAC